MSKPTYLYVLSSSCQMYSGTGRVTFDWLHYARRDFDFSVIIDSQYPINVSVTNDVCRKLDIPMYLSAPLNMPGCADSGVRGLAAHLTRHHYDFIECISWANAAANSALLASRPAKSRLLYTPHSQPLWTLGSTTRFFMTSTIFQRMLLESDATFVLSRTEVTLPEFAGCDPARIHYTPNGVDTHQFHSVGNRKRGQVLCVCDFRERRKRVDLLIAAFERATLLNPNLRLVLAGRDSDRVQLPSALIPLTSRLGYVTSEELVHLYQTSSLLALLSDYEAFGLPIAEALCCGTPVLLNDVPVQRDLFDGLPGVYFTRNTDLNDSSRCLARYAVLQHDFDSISKAAAAAFCFDSTYGRKRKIVFDLI